MESQRNFNDLFSRRGLGFLRFELPSTVVLTYDDSRSVALHEDRWWGRPTTLQGAWGPAHALLKRAHGALFLALLVRQE